MSIDVFVGPTLAADTVRELVGGAIVHGPIAHGDLLRLQPKPGGVVVIIDGLYHHRAPVRHKEILAALAAGVHVVGCSSMGALRAAELHVFGMIGNGNVFEMYRSGAVDSDEEVAIAHGDPPDYRRFSEPMVNVRGALMQAERAGVLTTEEAALIFSRAAALPYALRTWRAIEQELRHNEPTGVAAVERLNSYLAEHPGHADLKTADAVDTLARLDELISTVGPDPRQWTTSSDWRNQSLYEWQANFAGHSPDDRHVTHGKVLQYQQLYHDHFPTRWRAFALDQIAASAGNADGEDGALHSAARHGVGRRPLTPAQAAEWLTERESVDLNHREALLRVLSRSYQPTRGIYDLVEAFPDLIHDRQAREAVGDSFVVNDEIASWQAGQASEHIKESVILDHLAERWDAFPADRRTLRAHARDRGFVWLEDAVEAARQFFLREHLLASKPPSRHNFSGDAEGDG